MSRKAKELGPLAVSSLCSPGLHFVGGVAGLGIAAYGYDFVKEIAPQPGDVLLPKKHPSAFFATALTSHLIDLQADTLVITGCSTSGCVRSSVVDAFSLNFKVLVPQDAVYDRSRASHAVNLFDMAEKYADVEPATEIIDTLRNTDPPVMADPGRLVVPSILERK